MGAAPVPPPPAWSQMCLCGLCEQRLRSRALDLRVQARRLVLASLRAQDRRDPLRAVAYVRQATAATAEARECEQQILKSCAPRLFERFASLFAIAVRQIVPLRCYRLPQKWPTYFT